MNEVYNQKNSEALQEKKKKNPNGIQLQTRMMSDNLI